MGFATTPGFAADVGAGLANGFGGPLAPALVGGLFPTLGEGGGSATADGLCSTLLEGGSPVIPEFLGDVPAVSAPSSSDCSGIWTLSTGLFRPPPGVLIIEGVLVGGGISPVPVRMRGKEGFLSSDSSLSLAGNSVEPLLFFLEINPTSTEFDLIGDL